MIGAMSRVALALGVHGFTASGAVVGVATLLAIGAQDFSLAALLMLVALFIDSVDGTLARAARVKEVLPSIDGRRLDDMVDYLNYVIVPAVFMVAVGSLSSWVWTAGPVLASAWGFSQEDAKTEDGFFLGFPSYWNVVAIYLWLLDIAPATGTVIVALFSAAVFVPIKYLYPSQMMALRRTTTLLGGLWYAALVAVVVAPEATAPLRLAKLSLVFPAYYLLVSFFVGGLKRAPAR
jgi:phosphatidylcholine synthase